jgi:hypothetical protein
MMTQAQPRLVSIPPVTIRSVDFYKDADTRLNSFLQTIHVGERLHIGTGPVLNLPVSTKPPHQRRRLRPMPAHRQQFATKVCCNDIEHHAI